MQMGKHRPTEEILDATRDLDRWSAKRILEAIHSEDQRALAAVGEVLPDVERAADVLTCVLAGRGRWFNVGAGTSGRLGDEPRHNPTEFPLPARGQFRMWSPELCVLRA